MKQLAGKLGCTATTEDGIKKYFIEQCAQASVTSTLFAAGLWYLGYNTLDILLTYFLSEHGISGVLEDRRRDVIDDSGGLPGAK